MSAFISGVGGATALSSSSNTLARDFIEILGRRHRVDVERRFASAFEEIKGMGDRLGALSLMLEMAAALLERGSQYADLIERCCSWVKKNSHDQILQLRACQMQLRCLRLLAEERSGDFSAVLNFGKGLIKQGEAIEQENPQLFCLIYEDMGIGYSRSGYYRFAYKSHLHGFKLTQGLDPSQVHYMFGALLKIESSEQPELIEYLLNRFDILVEDNRVELSHYCHLISIIGRSPLIPSEKIQGYIDRAISLTVDEQEKSKMKLLKLYLLSVRSMEEAWSEILDQAAALLKESASAPLLSSKLQLIRSIALTKLFRFEEGYEAKLAAREFEEEHRQQQYCRGESYLTYAKTAEGSFRRVRIDPLKKSGDDFVDSTLHIMGVIIP